ncbi:MAG: Gfo/Idh/MocA family oxidoreductase [Clostridia bacterium]|nr:Gfo/Idh/MocA family oxidoreductase [Clostridia bacterium]
MKKFVILGCENSHADSFLKQMAAGNFPDLQCVGAYSNEPDAMNRLQEKFGVPPMERPDSMVGQVDGVIVTARNGIYHYEYAKPYIASGVPMFIDKPITCDPAEAVKLVEECRANGVRLCGGSVVVLWSDLLRLKEFAEANRQSILGGTVCAPVKMDRIHSGFWFYAQHLVQMLTFLFGTPAAVTARREGMRVSTLFHYKDFTVAGLYVDANAYHASVITKEESLALNIQPETSAFCEELRCFERLMQGAPMERTYEELIEPVFIQEAILRSYTENRTVEVTYRA